MPGRRAKGGCGLCKLFSRRACEKRVFCRSGLLWTVSVGNAGRIHECRGEAPSLFCIPLSVSSLSFSLALSAPAANKNPSYVLRRDGFLKD